MYSNIIKFFKKNSKQLCYLEFLDIYNPQNEMYQFSKRNVHFLNGAKVIKNTDRLGAYPCFFCLYILYRVVGCKDFYTLLSCAIAAT